jgi:hypothetical protein
MANATAYGFAGVQDFYSQRVMDYGVETVYNMVNESFMLYNRQFDAFSAMMVTQTTDFKRRYALSGSGFMQPIDDDGNPHPVIPSGVYDIAFPMQMYGTAWGTNRISRAKMTVGDANRFTVDAMMRDKRTEERRRLAALFTNVAWTFTDPEYGALTIQPLALTSDGVEYLTGNGTSATAQHYLAQANAISNTDDPYETLFGVLDTPAANVGDKIAFIPTNLVATTVALADFYPAADGNIQYGSGVSVASVDVNRTDPVTNSPLVGFGDRLLGYHVSGTWIVQKKSLPDSYILAIVDGADPVLAERIEPEAELQGLFPEYNSVDGNHEVTRLIRRNGYGVQNRVGAAILRVGNASYAIPTGYDARLALWT